MTLRPLRRFADARLKQAQAEAATNYALAERWKSIAQARTQETPS